MIDTEQGGCGNDDSRGLCLPEMISSQIPQRVEFRSASGFKWQVQITFFAYSNYFLNYLLYVFKLSLNYFPRVFNLFFPNLVRNPRI